MRKAYREFRLALMVLIVLWPAFPGRAAGDDPWARLRARITASEQRREMEKLQQHRLAARGEEDPWQTLRRIVIPFAQELEREETVPGKPGKLALVVEEKLAPWKGKIAMAADFFAIPESVIKAVIMVESGGDPRARAATSSAAGLMQTIAATFAAARHDLLGQGIIIPDDPCDPYASIMAGCWYLDRMFDQAAADGKSGGDDRSRIAAWRYPLEYYYAGPGHGRKAASRVLIYAGGKKVMIDKRSYSRKVLAWARKIDCDRVGALMTLSKSGGES
jgi:soluble lytic murein transglycosylase-like protein